MWVGGLKKRTKCAKYGPLAITTCSGNHKCYQADPAEDKNLKSLKWRPTAHSELKYRISFIFFSGGHTV